MTPQQVQMFDKNAAAVLERILLQDCKVELVNTMKYEGLIAVQQGFQTFGSLAMSNLLSNPTVAGRFSAVHQYVDQQAINDLLK